MQRLADGQTLAEIAATERVVYDVLVERVARYKRRHRVRTVAQLVAHYVRNGWVD